MTKNAIILDDCPFARELLKHHMEILDWTVVETLEDPHLATQIVFSTKPDLVFCDLAMPDLNGFQVQTQLRENGYRGKIIAYSALKGPDIQIKVIENGFNDFLTKPFSLQSVKNLLKRVL